MIKLNAITFLCALGISLVITASIIGYISHNNNISVVDNQKDVREAVQNNNPPYLNNNSENIQEKSIFTSIEIVLIQNKNETK